MKENKKTLIFAIVLVLLLVFLLVACNPGTDDDLNDGDLNTDKPIDDEKSNDDDDLDKVPVFRGDIEQQWLAAISNIEKVWGPVFEDDYFEMEDFPIAFKFNHDNLEQNKTAVENHCWFLYEKI